FQLSRFFLPLLASMLAFSAFILLKKYFKPNVAAVCTFLLLVFPTLVQQSYDSPQNIVFFLLPLVFITLTEKRWGLTGLLISSMLLFNLFSSVVLIFILGIYAFFEKRLIVFAKSLSIFALCTMWWLAYAYNILTQVKITQLGSTLAQTLLMGESVLFFYMCLAAIALVFYLMFARKKETYSKFWIIYLLICFVGMVLPTVGLRAAEFVILFSIGAIMLLPEAMKKFKRFRISYVFFIGLAFFAASFLIIDYYEAPVFTAFEKQAFDTYLPRMYPFNRMLVSEYGGIGISTYTKVQNVWPGAFLDFTTDQQFASDTLDFYLRPDAYNVKKFIEKYHFDVAYLSQNTYYYTKNTNPWNFVNMGRIFEANRFRGCVFFSDCPSGHEISDIYRIR
ncbi:MAG: hypothetical protein JXA43_02815, partial [Candidatus Diapherotrites archaeon]|nr:hypothetical protein [Candidatus Diapherotrites archaeon]